MKTVKENNNGVKVSPNKTVIFSTASVADQAPVIKQNLGSGPKGQRSKMQIKRWRLKAFFKLNAWRMYSLWSWVPLFGWWILHIV